jgi:hypothetical protein
MAPPGPKAEKFTPKEGMNATFCPPFVLRKEWRRGIFCRRGQPETARPAAENGAGRGEPPEILLILKKNHLAWFPFPIQLHVLQFDY